MERTTAPPRLSGFDALLRPQLPDGDFHPEKLAISLNPSYTDYLKLHKLLASGVELEHIFHSLRHEHLPRYLQAAGWAAVEAGLAQTNQTSVKRNSLIESGVDCWRRALSHQQSIEASDRQPWLIEDSTKYRIALDIAHAPIFQAIVAGSLTRKTKQDTLEETLRIAALAQAQLRLAQQAGDDEAVGDLSGFGYECNGLITLNMVTGLNEVATPASARADSGHYYPEQTHDLSLISQHWGEVRSITPIEVKASASAHDRDRYKALIIRGKLHLSVPGKYTSQPTLEAFIRFHEGHPTPADLKIVTNASMNVVELLRLYKRGQKLGHIATASSVTAFRDKQHVEHMYTASN